MVLLWFVDISIWWRHIYFLNYSNNIDNCTFFEIVMTWIVLTVPILNINIYFKTFASAIFCFLFLIFVKLVTFFINRQLKLIDKILGIKPINFDRTLLILVPDVINSMGYLFCFFFIVIQVFLVHDRICKLICMKN